MLPYKLPHLSITKTLLISRYPWYFHLTCEAQATGLTQTCWWAAKWGLRAEHWPLCWWPCAPPTGGQPMACANSAGEFDPQFDNFESVRDCSITTHPGLPPEGGESQPCQYLACVEHSPGCFMKMMSMETFSLIFYKSLSLRTVR